MNNIKNSRIKERFSSCKKVFLQGMRDGVPIGLGYFAVSFSLGIAAKRAGLTAIQGFITSALVNASAGEYAGFVLIAANASYLEMALMILIANARYMLMSCALSQRFSPEAPLRHRILVGFFVTDEFFGIAIKRPENYLNPYYTYGAVAVASPCWAIGTALGIAAGNILPARIVSALGVALYGMFLAIIIPPSRKNKIVAISVAVSFVLSFAATKLPYISELSDGTRTIILTIAISAVAAILFPIKKEVDENEA